jgi:hypothetical protein
MWSGGGGTHGLGGLASSQGHLWSGVGSVLMEWSDGAHGLGGHRPREDGGSQDEQAGT